MKNATKFRYAKQHAITRDEWNELYKLVNKICDNHNDDKWWKVDGCIKACVIHALLEREAIEEYTELCEKRNEDDEN